jgi:mono/diheme cytochrome c family protein
VSTRRWSRLLSIFSGLCCACQATLDLDYSFEAQGLEGGSESTPSSDAGGTGGADAGSSSVTGSNAAVGPDAGSDMPGAAVTGPAIAPTATEIAKAEAVDVLETYCGSCHGDDGTSEGELDHIGDIDQLVESGLLIPLDSTRSVIIRRMRLGEMPPPYSGLRSVPTSQIDIVVRYIDNPANWGSELDAQ